MKGQELTQKVDDWMAPTSIKVKNINKPEKNINPQYQELGKCRNLHITIIL